MEKLILTMIVINLILVKSYDKLDSPLYEFERKVKIRSYYEKQSMCLKNLEICDMDGLIMKGILYDVLNSNKYEYTDFEIKPIVNLLRHIKKYYRNDYNVIMNIYDKKKQIKI